MIKKIADAVDTPEFESALLALDDENMVIILGKVVRLASLKYEGKSLGFLNQPGNGAVLASRSMLVKALGELDEYDAKRGAPPPPASNTTHIVFTADDLD